MLIVILLNWSVLCEFAAALTHVVTLLKHRFNSVAALLFLFFVSFIRVFCVFVALLVFVFVAYCLSFALLSCLCSIGACCVNLPRR